MGLGCWRVGGRKEVGMPWVCELGVCVVWSGGGVEGTGVEVWGRRGFHTHRDGWMDRWIYPREQGLSS